MSLPEVPILTLKRGKEKSVQRFHPWVFSGALIPQVNKIQEGTVVRIADETGVIRATGFYGSKTIAVRVLDFEDIDDIKASLHQKLSRALELRTHVILPLNLQTDVFRLFHGEGDGIPGLILDYYDGNIVMQCHHHGIYGYRKEIVDILRQLLGDRLVSIYDKSYATLHDPSLTKGEYLFGDGENILVSELGIVYKVDIAEGQKTGFFIDQRRNRYLIREYAPGTKVLNLFCYTGGFTLNALRGGASQVTSVDSSASAMTILSENLKLNKIPEQRHTSVIQDVMEFLKEKDEQYDLIICDPPAFAKTLKAHKNALQAYKRLNERVMRAVRPGGILFTFSCSQVVQPDHFRQAVFSAAMVNGRTVQVLHTLHQPPDHPVSIFHPEGEYLKGLVLRIN